MINTQNDWATYHQSAGCVTFLQVILLYTAHCTRQSLLATHNVISTRSISFGEVCRQKGHKDTSAKPTIF